MSDRGRLKRSLFSSRISDTLDKTFFAGIFLIGAVWIVLAKLNGLDPVLIAGTVVALMVIYVSACLATRVAQIREDAIGDNVYYLGFLFTLTSLGFALWQIKGSDDEHLIEELLSNFGIALISTVFGIFLRVVVNQLRRDPVEIEREVRLELVDASTRLKGDIHAAILHFNDLRHQMAQIVRESFEISIKQHSEALSKSSIATVTHLEQLSEKLTSTLDKPVILAVEAIGKASTALEEQTVDLTSQLRTAAQELRSASQSLSRSISDAGKRADSSTHSYVDKLQAAGDSLARAMTSVGVNAGPIGVELQRLREVIAQTVTAEEQAFKQISSTSQNHAATLSEVAKGISEVTHRVAENLAALNSYLTKVGEGVSNAMGAKPMEIATGDTNLEGAPLPVVPIEQERVITGGRWEQTEPRSEPWIGPVEPLMGEPSDESTNPSNGAGPSEKVAAAASSSVHVQSDNTDGAGTTTKGFWTGFFGRGNVKR